MDAAFLKETVGAPLIEALTAMAVHQPHDAIEYIGNYLINYADRKEKELKVKEDKEKVAILLKQVHDNEQKMLEERDAATKEAEQLNLQKNKLLKRMSAESNPEVLFDEALDFIQTTTGASAAYLGRKYVASTGEPSIDFMYASQGAKSVVGSQLKVGPASEDVDENGVSTSGAPPTFDLWKELPPEPKNGEGLEEESEDASIKTLEKKYPPFIHVENVMLEPRINFLGGFPRLGAFLAVRLQYDTVLHDEGIIEMVENHEEEKSEEGEDEEKDSDAGSRGGLSKAASGASVHASAASLHKSKSTTKPHGPEIKWVMNPQHIEMCLCLHTLGQGRWFKPSEIQEAVDWAQKLSDTLSAAEKKLFEEDVQHLKKQKEESEKDAKILPDVKAQAEKTLNDFLGGLGDNMPSYERELIEKSFHWDQARKRLLAVRARLLQYSLFSVPPKPVIMHVFVALLMMLGYPESEIFNQANGKPDWKKIKKQINADAFSKLEAYHPAKDKCILVEKVRSKVVSQLEASTATSINLETQHLPVEYLKNFLETSMKAEEAYIAKKEALANAAAAEKAEEEEA